jgi:putative hemolysin
MGLIHPRLRTAMLPRELLNKRGRTIRLRIGTVIPFSRLDQFEDERQMTSYIRKRTFVLQYRPAVGATTREAHAVAGIQPVPVVEGRGPNLVAREVAGLSAEQTITEQGEFAVHIATAQQIPQTLNEIGRLREITFRATGEGTGKSIDLDKFDADYLHLFVWHKTERCVVGAYRLGQTDVILAKRGLGGLYTQTLFDYDRTLLDRLGPALEMGRSFVRAEYQRTFTPLLLLWKGIAQYAASNPRYRVLFGGVSISNNYQTASRQLLAKFLLTHHGCEWGRELVRPRNPFAVRRLPELEETASLAADDGDLVSDLIADIEPDQKRMPILIRQYLKLGAKFLAFNVDPSFGNCLDGLIMVNLARTEPRILERYMGAVRMKSFMDHHAVR